MKTSGLGDRRRESRSPFKAIQLATDQYDEASTDDKHQEHA
jgi:hypothetical protein